MPIIESKDGRYWFVIDDPNDHDQCVVYRRSDMTPLWDRHSYEASHGRPPAPDSPGPVPGEPHPGPVVPAPPAPVLGGQKLIRVTDPSDGDVINRGYAYWSQVTLLDRRHAMCFAGFKNSPPKFFMVDMLDGVVTRRLGPVIPYVSEGQGWHFQKYSGWVYVPNGSRLLCCSPYGDGREEVMFDLADRFPDCIVWQPHSSDDGRTHSCTVQHRGTWQNERTVVYRDGQLLRDLPRVGDLDESQISRDGHWLLIQESHNNRVVNVDTGAETFIANANGALAHVDMGWGVAVGEDDFLGACVQMSMANHSERRVLYGPNVWPMGHVSLRGDRCVLSNATAIIDLAINGSGWNVLHYHGMTFGGGDEYDYQVHANLDPTGRVVAFVSNHGTSRMDLDLLVLP